MKGTMLIISPSTAVKTRTLTAEPKLEELQEEVGGWLEHVPQFDTLDYRGTVHPCVALCNEEGKLKGMEANARATAMWRLAQTRRGAPVIPDTLCGKVVVIFGDRELMESL